MQKYAWPNISKNINISPQLEVMGVKPVTLSDCTGCILLLVSTISKYTKNYTTYLKH